MTSEMSAVNKSLATASPVLVNDHVLNIFVLVFMVIASGAICFVGIIFNVINIIVFYKQGFKDTVNITLFSLAFSDIGVLMMHLWMSICYNPQFASADLPFIYQDIHYLTSGWPNICFSRITGWLTVFVTLERCLCVALPLKVKTILTPRRTTFVVVAIYFTTIAATAPAYYAIRLGPKYIPPINETKIGLFYVTNGVLIESFSSMIHTISQFVCYVIVLVCTPVLVFTLRRNSKWRQSTSNFAKQDNYLSKDKKVVKMILLISVIFILCYLPAVANAIAMMISVEYSVVGANSNMFILTWGLFSTVVAANSTVNIFIYFNMSSKFRQILKELLRINKKVSG